QRVTRSGPVTGCLGQAPRLGPGLSTGPIDGLHYSVGIAGKGAHRAETVASEATFPYNPGSARSRPRSARQSPPSADDSTRSLRILSGSWVAVGLSRRAKDNKRYAAVGAPGAARPR